ncbi:MAG TPA: nucleoside hydrolase [Candidatus Nanoperiomorbaceae bacterium]|nr:nucleoside hydrolase [Candidatus Nanoperiomorbaceae bacterium]HMR86293.1 nucleoside hydrolase [Candidatus Nanoperiomorbaceae bacterium]HMU12083.1 nucleoside hydrolase [Candidatus Nanoperiomorbaceae bacterium]
METTMNKKKLIIDTDPGHDDALAILLMCAAPNIEISAVTTVAGNSTIQNVTNNAKHILTLAGQPTIPLFSGADKPLLREQVLANVHGASGLDGATITEQVPLDGQAIDKILRIVDENPGEITLLILGPQTNIAQAIQRDAKTMQQIKELVIMGGAFDVPGNKNRVAEFNICVDPDAAAIVAEFPVKKTYIPLDVCNDIQVPIEEFARIKNDAVRSELQSALAPYIQNIQRSELSTRGALMYDALAAYFVMKPKACEIRDEAIVVETKGEFTYGMTLIDRRPFSKKEPVNAQIVTFIPEQQFIDDYFETLNEQ